MEYVDYSSGKDLQMDKYRRLKVNLDTCVRDARMLYVIGRGHKLEGRLPWTDNEFMSRHAYFLGELYDRNSISKRLMREVMDILYSSYMNGYIGIPEEVEDED